MLLKYKDREEKSRTSPTLDLSGLASLQFGPEGGVGVAVVVNSVVNMVVKVGVKMVVEKVVSMAWAPWRPGLSGRWPAAWCSCRPPPRSHP